jgi:hypothetical protein
MDTGDIGSRLKIFIVSHDQKLLDKIPKKRFLVPTSLNELDLPERLAGNQLAENRFLLTDAMSNIDASWVGFISARWNERFPSWPAVSQLDWIITSSTPKNQYFAPSTKYGVSGLAVQEWIKNQDIGHPGMSTLLLEAVDVMNVRGLAELTTRNISMGNNFIVSKDVARELMDFWQRAFKYFDSKYGFELPFSYGCPDCGFESSSGVGRWDSSRHAGFFYERITSLFFASRPDLVAVRVRKITAKSVRSKIISTWTSFQNRNRTCSHA